MKIQVKVNNLVDLRLINMLLEIKTSEFCDWDHNFQLRKSRRFSLIEQQIDKSGENQT